jgi:hypothetical protein
VSPQPPGKRLDAPVVGAENLCHLGKGHAERGWAFGHAAGGSWPNWRWDDLRLVGLKLIFLVVSRAVSLRVCVKNVGANAFPQVAELFWLHPLLPDENSGVRAVP